MIYTGLRKSPEYIARVAVEEDVDAVGLSILSGSHKELIAETNYPSFDVDGACEAFFEWKDHKKADIMAFRNNAYRSVITGTMAPIHHTPWKDALEDSMESYLRN